MLFWIFVIIAVLALIGIGIFAFPLKTYRQWERLDDECNRLSDIRIYMDFHDPRHKAIGEELNKARQARREFEETHPNCKQKEHTRENLCNICIGFLIGAGIVLLIMGLILAIAFLSAPAERAALEAEYEVLSWEVANDVYTDGGDDVVGKKELYNNVREWNKSLAANQMAERNFWYGIFVPNIYGDLKPIELK